MPAAASGSQRKSAASQRQASGKPASPSAASGEPAASQQQTCQPARKPAGQPPPACQPARAPAACPPANRQPISLASLPASHLAAIFALRTALRTTLRPKTLEFDVPHLILVTLLQIQWPMRGVTAGPFSATQQYMYIINSHLHQLATHTWQASHRLTAKLHYFVPSPLRYSEEVLILDSGGAFYHQTTCPAISAKSNP